MPALCLLLQLSVPLPVLLLLLLCVLLRVLLLTALPPQRPPRFDVSVSTIHSCVKKADKSESAANHGLNLDADKLTLHGYKGYRSARATHGVDEGAWYYEVSCSNLGDKAEVTTTGAEASAQGHVRVGWCQETSEMEIPVLTSL